ncbi:unnamed protein product [Camellia sinensis]
MTPFTPSFNGGSCSHRLKQIGKWFGHEVRLEVQDSIMDVSVQYVDPVKVDLISPNEWGQLWSNCKQGSSTIGGMVAELGSALEDALVLLSASAPPLEGCEIGCHKKEKVCGKLIINQDDSLIVTSPKKIGEHAMLSCSRNMLFHDEPVSGKAKISNTTSVGQSSLQSHNPTSTSITSFPCSREKQGLHVGKLSVSWAPDVYDPPATSQSHTVKSHNQHHSMPSKKSYRHKHKGKSSRSSSTDKKHRHKTGRSSSKVGSY